MSQVYKNRFATFIMEAIEPVDLFVQVPVDEYPTWIADMGSGDFYFAVLTDARNEREIVKVKFDGSSAPDTLAVERGQEGTPAKAWARGSYLYQDITSAMLEDLQQQDGFRQGAFNPNATLSANYFGEKFYQTDLRLWWKSVGLGSEWRLIAGELLTAAPVFNPPPGSYGGTTLFDISSATPGADIYYTTDGTDPDDTSTPYTGPFTLPDGTTTLKAIAYGPERYFTPSTITSGVYIISSLGTTWLVQDIAPARAWDDLITFNGKLYTGASGRLAEWDDISGVWVEKTPLGGGGVAVGPFAEHAGKLYAQSGNGRVMEWDGVSAWALDMIVGSSGVNFLLDHLGVLYQGGRGGLKRYNDDGTWTTLSARPSGTTNCRGLASFLGNIWWGGDDGVYYIWNGASFNPAPGTPLSPDIAGNPAVDNDTGRLYFGYIDLYYHDGSNYVKACNTVGTGSISAIIKFGANICLGRFFDDRLFYWDGASPNEIIGTSPSPPAGPPPSSPFWWGGEWAIYQGTIWAIKVSDFWLYKWA